MMKRCWNMKYWTDSRGSVREEIGVKNEKAQNEKKIASRIRKGEQKAKTSKSL